ncbi:MAG: glycosyl transferase family 2 [Firmicutes bacterium]|nr:glycosyl transferase family 2 [Bacillota bacterium]
MKYISIVVPVYNEQENVALFYREICKHMETTGYLFELIFVDDGSRDDTARILKKLSQQDARVRTIILARNFGHQIALTCGLDHAGGDAVITMDGDMQHPPAMLPYLIKQWENGFEIVQTIRKDTQGVSWFKAFTSRLFYKTINAISNINIDEGGSDFRLLDRKAVDTFKNFKEKARFIRGIISAMGYKRIQIEFVAPERFAGKSKFSVRKMLNFALDGITAYSRLPLRLAFYMGLLSGLLSLLLTIDVVYTKWFTTEAVPGWATIAASVLLLGGLQLMGLGIIGEYIGRIFEEVKKRPLYWVQDELKSSVGVKAKTQDTVA